MIDWLTLRHPLYDLPQFVRERLQDYVGFVYHMGADGKITWSKLVMDIDKLRSDSPGIFWQFQGGGDGREYLAIGASPAALEHGCNVFGSSDIQHCATVLLQHAGRAMGCILPAFWAWQVRRMDITENYDLSSSATVKQALRYLLQANVSSRTRATGGKGDTVYFQAGAQRASGKAYHKGPQLRHLLKNEPGLFPDEYCDLADSVLRLEYTLKRKYFCERYEPPIDHFIGPMPSPFMLTEADLSAMHSEYFDKYIGSIEVTDVNTLLEKLEAVCPTKGQAKAAYQLWGAIRSDGLDVTKAAYITKSGKLSQTWYRNLGHLYAAGLSATDIGVGQVVQLRRDVIRITAPVQSWADLRRAA